MSPLAAAWELFPFWAAWLGVFGTAVCLFSTDIQSYTRNRRIALGLGGLLFFIIAARFEDVFVRRDYEVILAAIVPLGVLFLVVIVIVASWAAPPSGSTYEDASVFKSFKNKQEKVLLSVTFIGIILETSRRLGFIPG
jgi:hypothetical protein